MNNYLKPEPIKQIELDLLSVLNKHYYVNKQTFDKITPYDMAKHEICHLTKAVYKIQAACEMPNEKNIFILKDELAPDLIIYALEVSIAFQVPWWDNFSEIELAVGSNILKKLCEVNNQNHNLQNEMLNNVRSLLIKSVSRLGHLCDKTDHSQDSHVELKTEVILPFLIASFSIANFYRLDLDMQFKKRLRFVEKQYVGQPRPT